MANNRTMAELLRAPTEGYAEAIVVPPILAEQFELKHSLINMMTTDQFFGLEKDNPHDHIHQDSLNAAAGGNLLERSTQDVLMIIENKSKVRNSRSKPIVSQVKACDVNSNSEIAKLTHAINQQTSVVTTAMTAMLKQFQATPPPAPIKAVEEICVTCIGAHPYYQCLAAGGNTFPEVRDNIQGYVLAAAVNYNQGNLGYHPQEVDERVEETFTDPDLTEYTIKVPPHPIQKYNPPVPLILGRPFLRTTRTLIDVHGEEMILRDGDERLTLNMRHDTSCYSNQPQKESINLINVFNNSSENFLEDLFSNQPSGNATFLPHPELTSPEVTNDIFDSEGCNVLSEKLLDLDSTKDLHPPFHDNPLSGSTTYFSNSLLEEFINELAPITCLANLDDIFVNSIPEMFTDEHTLDYSSSPIFDKYDDDFLEVESDVENFYDDPFDSKGEKFKESKLFIDELDLPCNFLPPFEYDSLISQDFSRVDALP
uniref:Reverse transcriptase domain-containing protein n=1 Tax=Tanacetum cinerariifolium TaxID=118510 RepID=A0A6L2K0H6_TANCI|nr:reverse transcriptase domain-containing protein [Tanacetum cinerariifolium]